MTHFLLYSKGHKNHLNFGTDRVIQINVHVGPVYGSCSLHGCLGPKAACFADFASKYILCVCSICIVSSALRAGRALEFIFALGLHMFYTDLGCMYIDSSCNSGRFVSHNRVSPSAYVICYSSVPSSLDERN